MTGLPPAAEALLGGGAVDQLLGDQDRCPVDVREVVMLDGRNLNFRARLTDGSGIFVKQFVTPADGDARHVDANFGRALGFERFRRDHPGLQELGAPQLIAADESERIMIFEPLDDVRSMATLADENALTPMILRRSGQALGRLHGAPPDGVVVEAHRFPPLAALRAIPLATWMTCSAGELEAWRLMQQDEGLGQALARLRDSEDRAEHTPIHGDLRLDQVLVSTDAVHLTDFEDFRKGDPARDIGALLGELVYRAVLSIVKDWTGSFTMDVAFTHEEIVDRGAAELDDRLPLIAAFWDGYREVRQVDDDLLERSTAWLGWHMFDRLLAGSADRNKLLSVHRAAAGIGRAVVVSPQRYVDTLGMR